MIWRHKAGELIVPAIVLLGCLLYWLHIQDARSVARRVPNGVIAFTVAMTVLALLHEGLGLLRGTGQTAAAPPVDRAVLMKRVAFVLLCVGYYFAFGTLGFNLANFGFLIVAYGVAGLAPLVALPAAAASTVVFWGLARVMDFNVPTGPFGL
jgi:small-conductance mechanosensitive channel